MLRMGPLAARIWDLIAADISQYAVFAIVTLLVSLSALEAYSSEASAFQRYLGKIHPQIVLLLLFLIGLVLFSLLLKDGTFAIYRSGNYKGILLALALAVPFAIVAISVDIKFPFPKDMNVAYPNSLFFYPAIGYVAEFVFHVLPFGLLYLLLGRVFSGTDEQRIIWVSLLSAALLEPIFQVAYASSEDSRGVLVFVAVHLFLINTAQLMLFKSFDFLSMYAFRLSYYLLWHIVWGYARLRILF